MIEKEAAFMGWVERRTDQNGKVRYRAKYRDIREQADAAPQVPS
jgi:hypothetical protein